MSNFQLAVNVMDRIMSTSIILLDQNSNANDVDIMVFEPLSYSPRRSLIPVLESEKQEAWVRVSR